MILNSIDANGAATEDKEALSPILEQGVALLEQRVELGLLLGEPVGVARLVAGARRGRRLLDELADVVARDGDAVFELGKRE